MTNTKELLEKHPKVTLLIKGWLKNKMIESFKDETVPESFRELLSEKGIEDANLIPIIESNPHFLFYLFDRNNIFIGISHNINKLFTSIINTELPFEGSELEEWTFMSDDRLRVERMSIEKAIEILEQNL